MQGFEFENSGARPRHVLRRFLFLLPFLSEAEWPGKLRIAHLLGLRARASLGRSLPRCLPPSPPGDSRNLYYFISCAVFVFCRLFR